MCRKLRESGDLFGAKGNFHASQCKDGMALCQLQRGLLVWGDYRVVYRFTLEVERDITA